MQPKKAEMISTFGLARGDADNPTSISGANNIHPLLVLLIKITAETHVRGLYHLQKYLINHGHLITELRRRASSDNLSISAPASGAQHADNYSLSHSMALPMYHACVRLQASPGRASISVGSGYTHFRSALTKLVTSLQSRLPGCF